MRKILWRTNKNGQRFQPRNSNVKGVKSSAFSEGMTKHEFKKRDDLSKDELLELAVKRIMMENLGKSWTKEEMTDEINRRLRSVENNFSLKEAMKERIPIRCKKCHANYYMGNEKSGCHECGNKTFIAFSPKDGQEVELLT